MNNQDLYPTSKRSTTLLAYWEADRTKRGSEALQAVCELLVLLDKESLI